MFSWDAHTFVVLHGHIFVVLHAHTFVGLHAHTCRTFNKKDYVYCMPESVFRRLESFLLIFSEETCWRPDRQGECVLVQNVGVKKDYAKLIEVACNASADLRNHMVRIAHDLSLLNSWQAARRYSDTKTARRHKIEAAKEFLRPYGIAETNANSMIGSSASTQSNTSYCWVEVSLRDFLKWNPFVRARSDNGIVFKHSLPGSGTVVLERVAPGDDADVLRRLCSSQISSRDLPRLLNFLTALQVAEDIRNEENVCSEHRDYIDGRFCLCSASTDLDGITCSDGAKDIAVAMELSPSENERTMADEVGSASERRSFQPDCEACKQSGESRQVFGKICKSCDGWRIYSHKHLLPWMHLIDA